MTIMIMVRANKVIKMIMVMVIIVIIVIMIMQMNRSHFLVKPTEEKNMSNG